MDRHGPCDFGWGTFIYDVRNFFGFFDPLSLSHSNSLHLGCPLPLWMVAVAYSNYASVRIISTCHFVPQEKKPCKPLPFPSRNATEHEERATEVFHAPLNKVVASAHSCHVVFPPSHSVLWERGKQASRHSQGKYSRRGLLLSLGNRKEWQVEFKTGAKD